MSDYKKEIEEVRKIIDIRTSDSSTIILQKINNYLNSSPEPSHKEAASYMLKFYERVHSDYLFSNFVSKKSKISNIKENNISKDEYTKFRKDFDSLMNRKDKE